MATQIKSISPKCLFTHCYGHALNLAVGDVFENVPQLREVLDTAYEICKLIKKSPKRNTKTDQLRNETKNDLKSIHALCPPDGLYVVKVWHLY